MVDVPGLAAVAVPLCDTVTTDGLLLDHVTERPDNGLPLASRGVAVSVVDCPTLSVAEVGETITEATGTRATASCALPLRPSLVAVIVTFPAATPRTRPLEETVATPVSLDVHVTRRPVSGFPASSRTVAVS
jgi:hypothetical protein